MKIGVLALQGDFQAHRLAFEATGVAVREVRRTHELAGLQGLVLPGGESSTLLNLMRDEPWMEAITEFHDRGAALFGTCAGAILLSKKVERPDQPSLGLLDATIERNGFGRQVDSFECLLDAHRLDGDPRPLEAIFIRAPRFKALGEGVEVLLEWNEEPVMVKSGRVLAATFHAELTADLRVPQYFASLVRAAQATSLASIS